jgi:succinoglycan biosynthesis transport protein ExoP
MPDELEGRAVRSWDEYVAIGLRRRWWIVLPMFLCWAAVWGVTWLLPTTYQSEATIFVEQQKVSDQYILPNVTVDLQDRLQSVTQQILSRARLQATIDRFHLYPRTHGLSALLKPKDPIVQMRNDIQIDPVKTPSRPETYSAFTIKYSAGSPELAQQVNSELTSLFVAENVQAQQQLSENTTAFLASQLADARVKMEGQEAEVAAFKAKHAGELPSQLESNVQILAGLQAQLQNTQHTLDAAKQQKIYLESLRQQYQSAQARIGGGNSTVTATHVPELPELRRQLDDLRSRYMDDFPDIIELKDKIAKTEKARQQTEEEVASHQQADKATSAVDATAAEGLQRGAPTPMMQIESQLKANQLEIQNDQQRERDLELQIAAYQTRLNMTPQTEQKLADVSRGYEEAKSNYNSLLQKQMQSQLATSLNQRQLGEQFRIIDPPSLPAKPVAPNRLYISLGGLVLGFCFGLGLATVVEVIDERVRQEKDLDGIVPVRILVSIPHLGTPNDDHSRLAKRWMELGAAVAISLLVVAGNLYAFYKG